MKIIFFLSVFLCCFSYFLYPLILKGMSVRRAIAPTAPTKNLPGITLIITAHNEEARISSKLLNTHEIDYPMELLEVIVASDCSSDRTDEIVATHAQQGVRLVRADKRKGKEESLFFELGLVVISASVIGVIGYFLKQIYLRYLWQL